MKREFENRKAEYSRMIKDRYSATRVLSISSQTGDEAALEDNVTLASVRDVAKPCTSKPGRAVSLRGVSGAPGYWIVL